MVGGLVVSSITTGRIITRTGLWKRYLVGGMVAVIIGLSLLATIDANTPLALVGTFMAVLGLGLGATMQNLVLAVQDNPPSPTWVPQARWSRSSAAWVARSASPRWARCSATGGRHGRQGPHRDRGDLELDREPLDPRPRRAAGPIRVIFEQAFGEATGHIFLVAVPFAVAAFFCVLFIREVPLRTTILRADEIAPEATGRLQDTVEQVPAR